MGAGSISMKELSKEFGQNLKLDCDLKKIGLILVVKLKFIFR